MQQFMSLSNY